ncbi:hypothetical protein EU524_01805 [Candidatus Thorarchaeota archaeon]|nr:MAG: hypothetical protein EU524_01805 [Candidatus Thorarchaeota archaeon]
MSRRKRVFFDQTQNERGKIDSTYSELAQLLKDNDYDVESYTEFMILKNKIENANALVFGCPNSSKLRANEIGALKAYVENGGGLMLLSLSGGDRGLMNNMSKLSEEFGIVFENTAVKDERNNAGLPTMPIIVDFESHPITEGVESLLLPSACTLKASGKARVVGTTSATADPAGHPVIAVAEKGRGRVICVGSYEVFRRGGGMKSEGNKKFALNAFRWLCGDERLMKGGKKKRASTKRSDDGQVDEGASEEMENTMKRLVNAVFDLQKDIKGLEDKIDSTESNISRLREQFQSFAEKTQDQLGLIIPAKQFKTEEENLVAELEGDVSALEKEVRSVKQLRDHVAQKHESGSMSKETYDEQSKKLDERLERLEKRLKDKRDELQALTK